MWAEVGHYVPAVGPYGAVIALLVPIIAVLGTIAIIRLVSKSRIPEGDVRIRILGIRVRWGQSGIEPGKWRDSPPVNSKEEARRDYRLRAVDPDR